MPLYEYLCERCRGIDEIISNSFRDRPSKVRCSVCGGDSFFKISAASYKDGDVGLTMDRPEQVFSGYPDVVIENAKKYKRKKQISRGEKRISVGDK